MLVDLHVVARFLSGKCSHVQEYLFGSYVCLERLQLFEREGGNQCYGDVTYQDVVYYIRSTLRVVDTSCDVDSTYGYLVQGGRHRDEYIRLLTEFLECRFSYLLTCCWEPERGCKYGIDCDKLINLVKSCCQEQECLEVNSLCSCVYMFEKVCEWNKEKLKYELKKLERG